MHCASPAAHPLCSGRDLLSTNQQLGLLLGCKTSQVAWLAPVACHANTRTPRQFLAHTHIPYPPITPTSHTHLSVRRPDALLLALHPRLNLLSSSLTGAQQVLDLGAHTHALSLGRKQGEGGKGDRKKRPSREDGNTKRGGGCGPRVAHLGMFAWWRAAGGNGVKGGGKQVKKGGKGGKYVFRVGARNAAEAEPRRII
eukprot:364015-Chlamydomonas_euryale.AAC.7